MTPANSSERMETELRSLRESLEQLREEQRQMAVAVQELVTTFRTLATHLGIAAEPYVRKGEKGRTSEVPGFA